MKGKKLFLAAVLVGLLFRVGNLADALEDAKKDAVDKGVKESALARSFEELGGLSSSETILVANWKRDQASTFEAAGILDSLPMTPQQPDRLHGALATVDLVDFPIFNIPGSVTPPLISDINASLRFAGQVVDNARLLRISLRRYFGAVNDGNKADAEFQRNAACDFLVKLETSLLAHRNSLAKLSIDVRGSRAASISITIADALAFRNEIVQTGFPADELTIFQNDLRATADEITLARAEVTKLGANDISSSGLAAADIFDATANALGKIDIRQFLPQGFICPASPPPVPAPTLSGWGMIVMMLLLVTTGSIFILRRQPILTGAPSTGDMRFANSTDNSTFVPAVFGKVLACLLTLLIAALAAVSWLFGSISAIDIGGSLLCTLIFAYIVHLLVLAMRKDSADSRSSRL